MTTLLLLSASGNSFSSVLLMLSAKVLIRPGWLPQRSMKLHVILEGPLQLNRVTNKIEFPLKVFQYVPLAVVLVDGRHAGPRGGAAVLRVLAERHAAADAVAGESRK